MKNFINSLKNLKGNPSLLLISIPLLIFLFFYVIFPTSGYFIVSIITQNYGIIDLIILTLGYAILGDFFIKNINFKYLFKVINLIFVGIGFIFCGILYELSQDYSKTYPMIIEYNKQNLNNLDLKYNSINNYVSYSDKQSMDKYHDSIQNLCKKGEFIRNNELSKYECETISPYFSKIKFNDFTNDEWILNNIIFLTTDEFTQEHGKKFHNRENMMSKIFKL